MNALVIGVGSRLEFETAKNTVTEKLMCHVATPYDLYGEDTNRDVANAIVMNYLTEMDVVVTLTDDDPETSARAVAAMMSGVNIYKYADIERMS